MLDPDARSLYTDAVTPPPGYAFDTALATTFSLDPTALLSLPVHLALAHRPPPKPLDPILILESMRRLADRFHVYVDRAGMKPPSGEPVALYGLLESMITQVKAPRGGVFHPKVWLLRFLPPDADEPPLLRLLVLSRNITYDRSWDISLQLEGRPARRNVAANRPLSKFIRALPGLAIQNVGDAQCGQAEMLADEMLKTHWELPEGYESAKFHVLGLDGKAWKPGWAKRSAALSPFITDEALAWLRDGAEELAAVVSRPEEIGKLTQATFDLSGSWLTMEEAAETEDGEEAEDLDTAGLHAKAYIFERGWRTTLCIGSANATNAALLQRSNVEILAELVGKTSRVGGVETLLGKEGLGPVLAEYAHFGEPPPEDGPEEQARKSLEDARNRLAEACLSVRCEAKQDGWVLTLVPGEPCLLDGIAAVRAWPITRAEAQAVSAMRISENLPVELGQCATESVTGLVAFELKALAKPIALRLALNLPVEGLPENRDDAVLRRIINNPEGFLRYLLLLLGEDEDSLLAGQDMLTGRGWGRPPSGSAFSGDTPILEELVRAFSRNPERLRDVERVVNRLRQQEGAAEVVPQEFLNLWGVFKAAMEEGES